MKINDDSFSFLGTFAQTLMRSIFIALTGVAIIVLIGMVIWAVAQNGQESDPNKRKENNKKVWYSLIAVIGLVVLWPIVELIQGNINKPSGPSRSASTSILGNFFYLNYFKISNIRI